MSKLRLIGEEAEKYWLAQAEALILKDKQLADDVTFHVFDFRRPMDGNYLASKVVDAIGNPKEYSFSTIAHQLPQTLRKLKRKLQREAKAAPLSKEAV